MTELLVEIAKPMVEVLVNRVTEEIRLLGGLKNELNELESKVLIIGSIVNSTNFVADAAVEHWLRKVVRIIYKAEDVFDVLSYEKHRGVVMKRRPKKALTGEIKLVVAPLERVFFRSRIGSRIRNITRDFESALKEANTIVQVRAVVQSSSPAETQPVGTPARNMNNDELHQVRQHVDLSVFVGRDSDVISVVDMLCNPSQQPQHSQNLSSSNRPLSVVAVIGIGGVGKTSLARKVYENEWVISHFSERIWISDLKEFDIDKILIKMLESVGLGNCCSSDTAIRKLGECLGGKTYLLVMDDVWNTDQQCWDSLRYQLETIGGSMESMVLTTTRDEVVARTMQASGVHHLRGLSEHESWSLFQRIVYANRPIGDASVLEACGQRIVEKCMGVPLAIKSIAGLLQSKTNPHEWTIIEKSELWDIPHHKTGILPSLKLSYDHLSSPLLKKCFSLCALWPKGFLIEKHDFILRWIALGLVRNSNDENLMTMEDIGEEYLNELLSISFISINTRNDLGEAIMYTLHDLVHDLARSVAKNERLYLEASNKKLNNFLDIQHISIVGNAEMPTDFRDKLALENIRSLETWQSIPIGFLRHVKYLRVLALVESHVEELPEMIGELKCLKLLDLTKNPIRVFPECILELYNLQSLNLYRCQQLVEIPGDRLGDLVNLRHLITSTLFCPGKGVLKQLSQLQTLPPLQLSEGGFQISELEYLHQIKGKLEIKGLQVIKSKSDTENANLSKKVRVDQLRLSWRNDDSCTNYEEVLHGLYPHPNLKLLSIKGYAGDKFPSWLMEMNVSREHNNGYGGNLCNLIKFELINCEKCQKLPTLGHLSSLKMIVITNMGNVKHISPTFYYCGADHNSSSSAAFASLKELHLCHLGNLVEWCEPDSLVWSGFTSLEILVIEDCLNLKRMPNHFPSLRELTMINIRSRRPLLSILMNNKRSLRCLKKLDIKRVEELTHIPKELGKCSSLQTLFIRDCPKLTTLPENLSKLVFLEVLKIKWCRNLVSLPNLSGLGSLREFEVFRNDGLRGVPEGLQSCKSLEWLWIDCCPRVKTLPDLGGLSRLSNLGITGMTKMMRQPPDWLLYNLSWLKFLHIGSYRELKFFPDLSPLLNITSLEGLNLYGWKKLENIPQQLQHFTNLKRLGIVDFHYVEHLPDWLGNLSSLQQLLPSRCKKLKKLPSKDAMKRLTSLNYLEIRDCPLLEEATNKNGLEHHKIIAARIHVEIKNSNKNRNC